MSRMEHRLATFEHLTLASMQAQSDQNFSFLVVSSDRMPIEYRRRLEKMCEGRKQIVLRFVAPMHISEAIRQYAAEVEIDLADIVQFRLMMTIASRETTSAPPSAPCSWNVAKLQFRCQFSLYFLLRHRWSDRGHL